ncbi:MAG: ComEC/Rec2 family competence protein [Clostridia bacterium]|nr:ComEC/Rec2 family competence protein [Clostridia bacterium]
MKICNFRPMVCLALIAILAIGSIMYSVWLTILLALVLFVVLWVVKLPSQFKVVALMVYAIAIFSYLLTTYLVANPYQRTYNPNSGLRGIILGYVRWYLTMFLSENNANILYAMMFGDKSVLTWGLRSNFTATGLAHMLAVSGFHVGLVFSIITLLLKCCRVPKKAHVWIVTPILLFYAYLCGWQYTVMRAVIMCLVYAVARQYLFVADQLSVLSLSAVIILLVYPYSLISVSFLLSFSCVLGIYFWYQAVYRVVPVKSVAMYIAVMLGSFPFMVYFFGSIPIFGIIANVILVPLLVVCFYCGLFAVGTFVCGAVLWITEPLLNFVRWVTAAIGKISWATIPISHSLPAVFVYLIASVILSRFIFLRPKIKYPLVVALFTCYLVLLMV